MQVGRASRGRKGTRCCGVVGPFVSIMPFLSANDAKRSASSARVTDELTGGSDLPRVDEARVAEEEFFVRELCERRFRGASPKHLVLLEARLQPGEGLIPRSPRCDAEDRFGSLQGLA